MPRVSQRAARPLGPKEVPTYAYRLGALQWREHLEDIARSQVPPVDELALLSSGLIGLRPDGALVMCFGRDPPALLLDATSVRRLLPRIVRRRAVLARRLRAAGSTSRRAALSGELNVISCLVRLLEYFQQLDGDTRKCFSGRSRRAIAEAAAMLRPSPSSLAKLVL